MTIVNGRGQLMRMKKEIIYVYIIHWMNYYVFSMR